MKKMMLSFFIIFLIYCSCSQKPSKVNEKDKIIYKGYFFLQRLFPGTDPIANIKYSSSELKLKYFSLNHKLLYYSNSKKQSRQIDEALRISKIVNKRDDNIPVGKCCTNIKYTKYTPKVLTSPKKIPLFTMTKKTKKTKLLSINNANYCIEIFAPNISRWRLCSIAPIDLYRLHLKLIFSIIKSKSNFKDNKHVKAVIQKFLSNSMLVSEPVPFNWNWSTQKKWPGRCKSRFMQSPQKIEMANAINSQQPSFSISYNLLDTHVEIVRRFAELIVKFKNNPGLIRLKYSSRSIVYQPKYISFRFPGDHNILGKRYDGEMIIHCNEVTPNGDPKIKRTNGFMMSFPLESNSQYSNFDVLENLSVDFWRHMVNKTGKYTPTNFLNKKKLVFKLTNLMKAIVDRNPIFYFYLGSQTTPPCDEYVYHLVVGKPIKLSNCQLKVLRENSMASKEERQIHSRLSQVNEDADENNNDDDAFNDDDSDSTDKDKKNKGKKGKKGRGRGNKGPGIYVISKLDYDPDIDNDFDDESRRRLGKPLKPRKGKGSGSGYGDEDDEDELNC